jgi:hypothetical protein
MFVTELVLQLPMGWLKADAIYGTARDGWPRGVSVDTSREQETTRKLRGGPRTKNIWNMFVTKLVSQLPMYWLNAAAPCSKGGTDGRVE